MNEIMETVKMLFHFKHEEPIDYAIEDYVYGTNHYIVTRIEKDQYGFFHVAICDLESRRNCRGRNDMRNEGFLTEVMVAEGDSVYSGQIIGRWRGWFWLNRKLIDELKSSEFEDRARFLFEAIKYWAGYPMEPSGFFGTGGRFLDFTYSSPDGSSISRGGLIAIILGDFGKWPDFAKWPFIHFKGMSGIGYGPKDQEYTLNLSELAEFVEKETENRK